MVGGGAGASDGGGGDSTSEWPESVAQPPLPLPLLPRVILVCFTAPNNPFYTPILTLIFKIKLT